MQPRQQSQQWSTRYGLRRLCAPLLSVLALAAAMPTFAHHETTSSVLRLCAGESKNVHLNQRRDGSLAEFVPIFIEGIGPTERRIINLRLVELVIQGGRMQVNAGPEAGRESHTLRYRLGEETAHPVQHRFDFDVRPGAECGVRELREADIQPMRPKPKQPLGRNRNRSNPPPIYRPAPRPKFNPPGSAANPRANRQATRPPLGGSRARLPAPSACANPKAVSLRIAEASDASGQWAVRMQGVVRNIGQQAWVRSGHQDAVIRMTFNGRTLARQTVSRLEAGQQIVLSGIISPYNPDSDFNSEVVLQFEESATSGQPQNDCVHSDNVKRFGNDLLRQGTVNRR